MAVLNLFLKFDNSILCLFLKVANAISIFYYLFSIHSLFYNFYKAKMLACTLWASAKLHYHIFLLFLLGHIFLHLSEVEQIWAFFDFGWVFLFLVFPLLSKLILVPVGHLIFWLLCLLIDLIDLLVHEAIEGWKFILVGLFKIVVLSFMPHFHLIQSPCF